MLAESIFWASIACVGWCYLGYPLLIAAIAKVVDRRADAVGQIVLTGRVSVVLAVHNEQEAIERRLEEFVSLLRESRFAGEIIVVSDGSTDETVARARALAIVHANIRVVELVANVGKAAALTRGCAAADGEYLVFADARQRWAPDALRLLLGNFGRRDVGAVSGDLVLTTNDGANAGVGLYWRYEKWIRSNEARVHSTAGVSGAISAVRRGLFREIPAGILLDDLYWPLEVVLGGFRVVREDRAVAFDRLPEGAHGEFRRKVRTLTGNFQLLSRRPAFLNPFRNPIWFQFFCHKILRLLVPWALLAAVVANSFLPGPAYQVLWMLQGILYASGLLGIFWLPPVGKRFFGVAGAFLLLNVAAWLAFWVWISGKSDGAWRKVRYSGEID